MQVLLDNLVGIDSDLEGNSDFFPAQGDDRRVGLHIVEVIGERFMKVGRLRLHRDSKGVFGLVIGEASP